MSGLTRFNYFKIFLEKGPIILLVVSVLNEFDFNYLNIKYFSFNFPFILIYYWSLKRSGSIGYGLIFLSGLLNDVVVGLPIGLSALSYLLICGFSAYLRNITLRPSLVKDWLFFGFTILVVNSVLYIDDPKLNIYSYQYGKEIYFKSMKDIKAGQELLVYYGPNFWNK